MLSADSETWFFIPGNVAPPGVCWSFFDGKEADLVTYKDGLERLAKFLRECSETIVGSNLPFDFICAATARPELLKLIFKAYDEGRVHDVEVVQALDAIAKGLHLKDPLTGAPMQAPSKSTGKLVKFFRYNLWLCVKQVLGREDAKKNDFWRLRYALLKDKPIAEWPYEAQEYPRDDVRNPYEVAQYQLGLVPGVEPHENLGHHSWLNHYADWCLKLGAAHGVRTDPASVAVLKAKWEAKFADCVREFEAVGFYKRDKKTGEVKSDEPAIRRAVALAYGATKPCPRCSGTGRGPFGKRGNEIQCKACSSTGLDLEIESGTRGLISRCGVPLTDSGGVTAAADALAESDDALLEKYGEMNTLVEKALGTYLPFLEEASKHPATLEPNVLLETARTSYAGVIQLMPRGHGFRDCVVAPPGRVLCSVDYSAIELSTLAEACLEIVGWSKLADAINAGFDTHTLFAGKMFGHDYEPLLARVKAGDKVAKNLRQATKAANFGFPGFMGAGKLVLSKRKEGLRFCIALGQAPTCAKCGGKPGDKTCRICHGRGFVCGVKKLRAWKRIPLPPTCEACLNLAEDLRDQWFEMWPEMHEYFAWVKRIIGDGEGNARMVTPITGFIRGGLGRNAANHTFQHLAAYGAKNALILLNREAYLDESSPLWGARFPIFAHDEVIGDFAWERRTAAAKRMVELMLEGMRKVVKRVKVSAEPALMTRWLKDAEPVWRDGELWPWEPPSKKSAAA